MANDVVKIVDGDGEEEHNNDIDIEAEVLRVEDGQEVDLGCKEGGEEEDLEKQTGHQSL